MGKSGRVPAEENGKVVAARVVVEIWRRAPSVNRTNKPSPRSMLEETHEVPDEKTNSKLIVGTRVNVCKQTGLGITMQKLRARLCVSVCVCVCVTLISQAYLTQLISFVNRSPWSGSPTWRGLLGTGAAAVRLCASPHVHAADRGSRCVAERDVAAARRVRAALEAHLHRAVRDGRRVRGHRAAAQRGAHLDQQHRLQVGQGQ